MRGANMRRRKKPYDPAEATRVHDRRSTDLLRNAQVTPVEVEDPMALEPGATILVMRSTRNDVLAAMKCRGHIDQAQFLAGREYQGDFETVEEGPRAIDTTKEAVDGGRIPEPYSEKRSKATKRLERADRALGTDGEKVVRAALLNGYTMEQIALINNRIGKSWAEYYGRFFRDCLDCIAEVYGFAMERKR